MVSFLIKLQASGLPLYQKRLWYRCFPVNFARLLRAPLEHLFYRTPSKDCFWLYFLLNCFDGIFFDNRSCLLITSLTQLKKLVDIYWQQKSLEKWRYLRYLFMTIFISRYSSFCLDYSPMQKHDLIRYIRFLVQSIAMHIFQISEEIKAIKQQNLVS